MNERQYTHLKDIRMLLMEYATFFKLDGVFGSDIAKDGRLVIDYANRNVELFNEQSFEE